uniref:Uncharacterized protein n=1 Tax=Parascaris equorum TaxID=6256 RepID=A0A914SJJ4_PAREQ
MGEMVTITRRASLNESISLVRCGSKSITCPRNRSVSLLDIFQLSLKAFFSCWSNWMPFFSAQRNLNASLSK